MKQAMLLAAGLGTRLKPLTDTMPKALVPVAGQPLLYHVIQRLKAAGFQRVVVNVHHFGQQIIDYIAANNGFGLEVLVSDERGQLLDTGGGIRKAAPLFDPSFPVFIHNVDILSNLDISALYNAFRQAGDVEAALVVSLRHTPRQLQFNPVTRRLMGWQNTQTGELRGPLAEQLQGTTVVPPDIAVPLAFAGIHLVSPKLFPLMTTWPDKFSIITFYLDICGSHNLVGYEQPDFHFMDAGKLDTLAEAEAFLAANPYAPLTR
ncbi:MAG: nucleotidyltransferase family protein [Bacteroidaceae bacterium]|nr:nucleotidyltransferase family protein [Bacteroidaceae bacterium]